MTKTPEKVFAEIASTIKLLMDLAMNTSRDKAYEAVNGPKNDRSKNENDSKQWAFRAIAFEEALKVVNKAANDFVLSHVPNTEPRMKVSEEIVCTDVKEEKVEKIVCPSCSSNRVRHEMEHDNQGNPTADYWTCEECFHGWSFATERTEKKDDKFCIVKVSHTNKLTKFPKFEVYKQDSVKEERGMKIVERDFSVLSEATARCAKLNEKEK